MKEKIKHELLVMLQFLAILLISFLAVFAAWIFEITGGRDSHTNIYEAWQSLFPFFTKLIVWFSVFSLIRLIVISFISLRRKQFE